MIYTADMVGLIRTILIIVMIYYGLKFLSRYVLPIVLTNYIKKMQQNQQQRATEQNANVGETVVDKKPKTPKSSNNQVGVYVDFEEID